MITEYEVKTLKLNSALRGKKKGQIVRIRVDKDGIPIERYWRNRLKDAEIDNCVEFVKKKKKKKFKPLETKKVTEGGN